METEEREVWENLAEWDNLENPLAPLTEEQQKTIIELAALCDHKLTAQDVSFFTISPCRFIQRISRHQCIITQETTETKSPTLLYVKDKKHSETTILDSFASLKSGEKTIDSSQQVISW